MSATAPYKSIFGTNATDRTVLTPDELDLLDGLCEEADNHREATMERASVALIARLARELGAYRASPTAAPNLAQPEEKTLWDHPQRVVTERPPVSPELAEKFKGIAAEVAQEQKPVARYELFKDGDAWCCVADEFTNLQECLAGFGQSPELALDDLIEKENSERERLGIPDYRKSPIPASGWVMVPKLVSDSMLTAALEKGFQGHESHLQILWTAMLAESAVAVGETK